jgi:deazaflavin-dependent oxidoreductase (nitroreductase family)
MSIESRRMDDMTDGAQSHPYIPVPFLRRLLNPLAMRLGLAPALVVRGRHSGHSIRVPVRPIEVDGARYLVSNRGLSHWVRNLRSTPQAEIQRKGRTERIRAVEVDGAERVKAFGVYRDTARSDIKALLDKMPNAEDHPTFRLEPIAEPGPDPTASQRTDS